MSKKRTSAESSDNPERSEGSNSLFQQDDKECKRKRLDLQIDTTLQDLPIELLEYILIKTVAMEVESFKLAKSVWMEKVDPVIDRLRTVCPQWNSILTTNFYRNELHRTLDGMAQKTIRLEMLRQSSIQITEVVQVATMKDEMFMMCREEKIVVFDRKNLAVAKHVIQIPEKIPQIIATCRISNCLYVLYYEDVCYSLQRFTEDDNHQFNISPWLSNLALSNPVMSVSDNGNLIILSHDRPSLVSIYDIYGSLQHEIHVILSLDNYSIRCYESVIQKSDGSLLLISSSADFKREVTELDMNGTILRQYRPPISKICGVHFADRYGRIALVAPDGEIELLDSELNRLNLTGPRSDETRFYNPKVLHYDDERDEIVCVCYFLRRSSILTIFRLKEE